MTRRDLLAMPAAALIRKGDWLLRTDAAGNIVSLRRGALELVDPAQRVNTPLISGPARVRYRANLIDVPGIGTALEQTIALDSTGAGTVRVDLPRPLRLPNARTFSPLKNGVAHRTASSAVYEFAGAHAAAGALKLALPMQSVEAAGIRLTTATDPAFTAAFGETLHWIYPDTVPLPPGETRKVHTCLHSGDDAAALGAYYATALQDVRPGPDWLHDIAMVDYDFLSKNGRGWFADIDALERLVPKADRHKVILALHGWYDYCGRYSFDVKTGALDRRWTAFPNARSPEFQKLAERPDNGSPFYWAPAAVRAVQPVEMTLGDMHRRIGYAKTRGFRVALYFADGLNACDGTPGFDPARVLRWGGWTGPETKGKSYCLNPLHPEVPAFFRRYLAALLAEYGSEIDALVWDETFYVQGDDHGAGEHRGYAARAMMSLVKELTRMTGAHRRELAFLASDDVGVAPRYNAPYALVAHGTYQDSACTPKGWPYGLFPNFRNTLWSCHWAPMKAFERSQYAVETFDVPVPISNGYAEDRGISEMNPEQLGKIAELFNARKQRRMDITWIEERNGAYTYRGRPVKVL